MSTTNELLMVKGAISDLPCGVQSQIKVGANKILAIIGELETENSGSGLLAMALAGLTLQEENK